MTNESKTQIVSALKSDKKYDKERYIKGDDDLLDETVLLKRMVSHIFYSPTMDYFHHIVKKENILRPFVITI